MYINLELRGGMKVKKFIEVMEVRIPNWLFLVIMLVTLTSSIVNVLPDDVKVMDTETIEKSRVEVGVARQELADNIASFNEKMREDLGERH